MNSVKALTELMRSLTEGDLKAAHEDEVSALSMQIPRLSRRLVADLQERGLMERPRSVESSLTSLLGGSLAN